MDYQLKVMISEAEIDARIRELGAWISEKYKGESVHLIGILKGSVFFVCELAKRISIPVTIDFMSVSSYGNALKSSGVVKIVKDTDEPLEGKNVIVVEDIIDTGRTLSYLLNVLSARHPKSMLLCTLLDKPEQRVVDVDVDFSCFKIENKFVVGYGLDFQQTLRNLPYVAELVMEESGE